MNSGRNSVSSGSSSICFMLAMLFEKMLWYVAIPATLERTMRRIIAVSFMLLLLTLAAVAQQAAIGFCALDNTLDFKTAKAGDKIALHLTRDLVVKGKTLIPRRTALSATVVDAKDGNTVSIVLDR